MTERHLVYDNIYEKPDEERNYVKIKAVHLCSKITLKYVYVTVKTAFTLTYLLALPFFIGF